MTDWIAALAHASEAEAAIVVHAEQAQHHLRLALANSAAIGLDESVLDEAPEDSATTGVSARRGVTYGHHAPMRLGPSARGGIGVFARRAIEPGDIVERCPLLRFPSTPRALADYTVTLRDDDEHPSALPLGFGAIYNHSATPNTVWRVTHDLMTITATRHIAPDAEILINYGPEWFTCRAVEEITEPDGENT